MSEDRAERIGWIARQAFLTSSSLALFISMAFDSACFPAEIGTWSWQLTAVMYCVLETRAHQLDMLSRLGSHCVLDCKKNITALLGTRLCLSIFSSAVWHACDVLSHAASRSAIQTWSSQNTIEHNVVSCLLVLFLALAQTKVLAGPQPLWHGWHTSRASWHTLFQRGFCDVQPVEPQCHA